MCSLRCISKSFLVLNVSSHSEHLDLHTISSLFLPWCLVFVYLLRITLFYTHTHTEGTGTSAFFAVFSFLASIIVRCGSFHGTNFSIWLCRLLPLWIITFLVFFFCLYASFSYDLLFYVISLLLFYNVKSFHKVSHSTYKVGQYFCMGSNFTLDIIKFLLVFF